MGKGFFTCLILTYWPMISFIPVSSFGDMPLNCSTSPLSSCSAYLFISNNLETVEQLSSLYNVTSSSIQQIPGYANNSFISVNCACSDLQSSAAFFAFTTYTVRKSDTNLGPVQISQTHFNNLAWSGGLPTTIYLGETLPVKLLCGCPYQKWKSIISYQVQYGDSVEALASRFMSEKDSIGGLNQITNISRINAGQVLFIPSTIPPRTNPAEPPPKESGPFKHKYIFAMAVIIGVVIAILLALLIILMRGLTTERKSAHNAQKEASYRPSSVDLESNSRSKGGSSYFSFLTSWTSQFKRPGSINNNVKRNISLPEAKGVFDSEKPIVFSYEEILVATGKFLQSRKLGEGSFGAVYFGNLRDQNVAVKQMKASKSREFLVELKVLCKVHHSNLVELIGYAVGEDELYLVYEFAENGALSDRLHNPVGKGYQPLSWTSRVQIALDAARGLEYIHEHTKTHYVHRDIKTSNILLDGLFRAKVADFGLAKLVEQQEAGGLTTRVVGTVGYLAPEYIRDGHVTSKSDVYAFGVVLMELITGQQALTKSRNASDNQVSDHRSLVSLLNSLYKDEELNETKLKSCIDPNIEENYPLEEACKMVQIAKSCLEDDSMIRPDMREIVFKLSHLLLTSIEWEASLAGSSQIFSGLVQGR